MPLAVSRRLQAIRIKPNGLVFPPDVLYSVCSSDVQQSEKSMRNCRWFAPGAVR